MIEQDFPGFLDLLAQDERNIYVSLHKMEKGFSLFRDLVGVVRPPADLGKTPPQQETLFFLYFYFTCYVHNSIAALMRGHYDQSLATARVALDACLIAYVLFIEPQRESEYKNKPSKTIFNKITNYLKDKLDQYPLAQDIRNFHGYCSERGAHADWTAVQTRAIRTDTNENGKEFRMAFSDLSPKEEEFEKRFVELIQIFAKSMQIFHLIFKLPNNDIFEPNESRLLLVPQNRQQEWLNKILGSVDIHLSHK